MYNVFQYITTISVNNYQSTHRRSFLSNKPLIIYFGLIIFISTSIVALDFSQLYNFLKFDFFVINY